MLQQILKTMTVDPEILAELAEDQKQVLFYKIREEQVRRWKVREEKADEDEKKKPLKAVKQVKKNVDFLTGKDGCEWVWIMGEHPNDKSIEKILEEEAKEKAGKMAEAESEALRLQEEAKLLKKTEQEKQRIIRQKDEREAEMKRKQEEAELYQTIKEARLAIEKMELEKKKQEEEKKTRLLEIEFTSPLIQKGQETAERPSPILNSPFFSEEEKSARRKSREVAQSIKEKRSSEIYITLQQKRKDLVKQAEEGQKEVETSWQEQEKKSKEADIKMRESARQARTEYRESLRRSLTVMQAAEAFADNHHTSDSNKPPVPPKRHKKVTLPQAAINRKLKPANPENQEMIINWFQKEEVDRVGVLDSSTRNVVQWFHGIISRVDAEKILLDQKSGSFLVRVSERVWGYTLSYRGADRCKHFLVDASESGYQFIGASQTVHSSLASLVKFHKDTPITVSGQEKLLYPCGQIVTPPDYSELFRGRKE